MASGPRWGARVDSGAVNGVIVGAALVRDGKLLAQQRAWPPGHAGQWELPGGRVEAGESDAFALARECSEELDVVIEVGDRVGQDDPAARRQGPADLRRFARLAR